MTRVIEVGIIGCGGMGTTLARTALRMPSIRIMGACDKVEAQAKTLATEAKCDYYTEINDLLSKHDFDAVIVATPNYTHRDLTIVSLEAGKHVFCEKPMALTLEDCDAMIDTARRNGLTLMIGHVMRYWPGNASAKQAIANGEIGKPIHCQAVRTYWAKPGTRSKSWRQSKDLCGNGLFEVMIHDIDLMRWFTGDVESVQAYGANFAHPEYDYEDCFTAILKFKDGALGTLVFGNSFRSGDWRIKVNGTTGSVLADFAASPMIIKIASEGGPEHTEPLLAGSEADLCIPELQHFVKCILDGTGPLTDGWEGRSAVEIATAITQSAESGGPVKFPLRG